MHKPTLLLATAAAIALGACKRTESGDIVVKRPEDVKVQTTEDTLRMPQVTTRTDTVNAPVVGVKKDTVIVDKPVVGTEKKTVKVPVITKP
jgi:hypothetical protein